MISKVLPWQEKHWQSLWQTPQQLPHALLVMGPAGIGKHAFALALAARLLCERPQMAADTQQACGQCQACQWLACGQHPDFRLLQPETDEGEAARDEEAAANAPAPAGKPAPGRRGRKGVAHEESTNTPRHSPGEVSQGPIRIDQVRSLNDFVYIASHRAGRRVVVVQPAEMMNAAAANALLKILEEPPAGVHFILVATAWRKLLPTIRSRCRQLNLGRPSPQEARAWLTTHAGTQQGRQGQTAGGALDLLPLAGGAPLLAQRWAEQGRLTLLQGIIAPLETTPFDPLAMATTWSGLLKGEAALSLAHLVDAVQKWVYDLLQLRLAAGRGPHYHQAWQAALVRLAAQANLEALLASYQELLRLQAVAYHPLNSQLFLEDLAARYVRIFEKR